MTPSKCPRAVIPLLALLSLLVCHQSAFGQSESEACKALPPLKDFVTIADTRGQLQNEIPAIESRIKEINSKLPQAAQAEKDLQDTQAKIDELKNKPNKSDVDQQQLDTLSKTKQSIGNFLAGDTVESLKTELKKQEDNLSWKKEQLRCVQTALSQILSPEQNFKFWMSLFFAALIGLVILGFFYLAGMDASIRRAIFAGQSGLQFLTLFSIVIAIILFGITSILQDKELAALLGGLSGYILGRYSAPGRRGEGDGGDPAGGGQQDPLSRIITVSVAPASASLSAAAPTRQLTATPMDAQGNPVTDAGAAFTPQWASDNAAVATVSQSGLVTFVAPGSCNVTATFDSTTSNSCAVTCT
jgi:hypothetical protein